MADELKDHYDYVIVGAGVAAASAATAIRAADPAGSIAVLGADTDPPVYRPDLSKKLWLDDDAEPTDSEVDLPDETTLALGVRVEAISPEDHQVTAGGKHITYRKLLLATGGEPRTLDLPDDDRIVYFRTLADYRRLHELAPEGAQVTVVGGGFIGSELASALTQHGAHVTWVMPNDRVQDAVFPPDLATKLTTAYADKGVALRTGAKVTGGRIDGLSVIVQTDGGDDIIADVVVVGAGIVPDDQIAADAGISTDNGVIVDAELRTSAPDVFAAGDVARYDDALLGVRRVEHVDNAEKMGEVAGGNMAGKSATYAYTPIFWSDLFEYGYEAVGDLSAKLDTVEDWNDEGDAGVVYYLGSDGTVRGVLLWNVWDSTDKAREVIADSKKKAPSRDELIGRIPLG